MPGATGCTGARGATGCTGPMGCPGPASGLEAFAGKYSDTCQKFNLIIGSQCVVPLPCLMPSCNMNTFPANAITVTQCGTYEINYSLVASAVLDVATTLAVRVDGVNVPAATISRLLLVGTDTYFSGSILVNLNAGDTVDLAISALFAASITLGSGVNATLTLKKISS